MKKYIIAVTVTGVILLFWLIRGCFFAANPTATETVLHEVPHLVIWNEELPGAVNLRFIKLNELNDTDTPGSYRSGPVELAPVFHGEVDGKETYSFRIFDWSTYEKRDVEMISYRGENVLPIQRGRHWGVSIMKL